MMAHQGRQRGFTLVEAVIVIVITGILGAIVATFLRLPVQNYQDSVGRAELTDVADSAVRRITREIRLALPNSLRVSGDSLEFIPTKTGGRYLAADDGAGDILDFANPADTSFSVVGGMPTGRQRILAGDQIVVYNLGPGFAPADAYAAAGTNRAQVAGVNQAGGVITLASNPFAAQSPVLAHPEHRFLVATQPVTFRCAGGFLYRYTNYGFTGNQVEVPGGERVVLATNVKTCSFAYAQVGTQRAALVRVSLTLERASGSDGPIQLTQQIHVDNTP